MGRHLTEETGSRGPQEDGRSGAPILGRGWMYIRVIGGSGDAGVLPTAPAASPTCPWFLVSSSSDSRGQDGCRRAREMAITPVAHRKDIVTAAAHEHEQGGSEPIIVLSARRRTQSALSAHTFVAVRAAQRELPQPRRGSRRLKRLAHHPSHRPVWVISPRWSVPLLALNIENLQSPAAPQTRSQRVVTVGNTAAVGSRDHAQRLQVVNCAEDHGQSADAPGEAAAVEPEVLQRRVFAQGAGERCAGLLVAHFTAFQGEELEGSCVLERGEQGDTPARDVVERPPVIC